MLLSWRFRFAFSVREDAHPPGALVVLEGERPREPHTHTRPFFGSRGRSPSLRAGKTYRKNGRVPPWPGLDDACLRAVTHRQVEVAQSEPVENM